MKWWVLATLTGIAYYTSLVSGYDMFDPLPNLERVWTDQDPDQTRKQLLQIERKHAQDAPNNYIIKLRAYLARSYSLEGQFQLAHSILDSLESRVLKGSPYEKILYFLERGRTYGALGDILQSEDYFSKAYNLSLDNKYIALAIESAHLATLSASNLDGKEKWSDLGISAANLSADQALSRWSGIFKTNLAWSYFSKSMYGQSLSIFRRASQFYRNRDETELLAKTQWSVAKVLRHMGKIKDSLEIQIRLLEQTGGIDESGYIHEELGEIYLELDNDRAAAHHFGLAYEFLSRDGWLTKNADDRLARLRKLSLIQI